MPKVKKVLSQMAMPRGVAKRWRKIYGGKNYYFRGEYADALKQWEKKKFELDGTEVEHESIGRQKLKALLAKHESEGNTEGADNVRDILALDDARPGVADRTQRGLELLDNWLTGETPTGVKTVADAVTSFMTRQQAKTVSGALEPVATVS